jgi:hypothetical protein
LCLIAGVDIKKKESVFMLFYLSVLRRWNAIQKFSYTGVLFIVALFVLNCQKPTNSAHAQQSRLIPAKSVIQINATRQGYYFHRPWQQKPTATGSSIGVIIKGPKVLSTASFLANHRYIELEKIGSGEKRRAIPEVIDYESNLAILKPVDDEYLADMHPLSLTSDAIQGDKLQVWQVQPNGNVIPGQGVITAIELSPYSYHNQFLVYRLNGSLQYSFKNFSLPVVKDDKLAGLVMRYDAKKQTIDVICAPVIEHFLEDTADGQYAGFPVSGIRIASTQDPQLRRYVGLEKQAGGVYVEHVNKNKVYEEDGLKSGDIILKIAGFSIDSRGNYEHPQYGKISLSHLIRCEYHVGDKIDYTVFRNGNTMQLQVMLYHRLSKDFLVPPYIIDAPPRYYVLGGLVLQELSVPYLRAYGKNWAVNAPVNLVYYAQNQDILAMNGQEKIVILAGVLPTSFTLGYEKMTSLVITHINHRTIGKLEDVAAALDAPVDGFHKIEFEQHPKTIFLDPREIPLINAQIQKRYRLPALNNMN